MRILTAAFGLAALLAVPAHAGIIGPAKPSDVVNVVAMGGVSSTTCGGQAVAFDTRVTADGARVPFEIPPGEVFVVTGYQWDSYFAPASTLTFATIVTNTPTKCDTAFSSSTATSDAKGNAGSAVTFPTGIVVRPGVTLGVFTWNSTLDRANVYGYFTRDK